MKSKVRGRGRGRAILSCDKTELNNLEETTSKDVDVNLKSDQEHNQIDNPKPSADTEQDDEQKSQLESNTESNVVRHIDTDSCSIKSNAKVCIDEIGSALSKLDNIKYNNVLKRGNPQASNAAVDRTRKNSEVSVVSFNSHNSSCLSNLTEPQRKSLSIIESLTDKGVSRKDIEHLKSNILLK